MNILTVIPLAKGIPRNELSYFSARDVAVGTIVTVPFGGRKIRAVVADVRPVRDLKAGIKGASFQLKNITEIHSETLPQHLFSAAQNTARFFAQPVGPIVATMIPKELFEFYLTSTVIPDKSATAASGRDPGPRNNTGIPDRPDAIAVRDDAKISCDIQILQIPYSERISFYKTLIRENLAKKTSTMIVVPTIVQAEKIFESIKTGIEDRIIILHGKIAKKKMVAQIKIAITAEHPIVAITTAPFASIMRNDWNTVVLEESGSPHYRYDFGPRFDMRYFVEHAVRASGVQQFIYADTFIGIDIRARAANKEISDLRSTWHIAHPEDFTLIDLRPDEQLAPPKTITLDRAKKPITTKSFELFHADTRALIEKSLSQKSKIVLLANRKGIAPLTVCSDCGTTVTCPHCETPLVLHRTKTKGVRHPGGGRDPGTGNSEISRTYICHHCLQTTPPIDHCKNCLGSRLTLLGISTDRIADEIEGLFPDAKIFLAGDEDKTLQKMMKEWDKASSGILIGTHTVLPYLESIPYGAIISFDSLLSLPAYTCAETGLHTILSFLEKVTGAAIIQTRNAGHDAVQAIQNENLFDFVRNEITSRAQFGYPPAKILVKISLDGKKSEIKKVTEYFETVFRPYDPDILMKKSKKMDCVIVQAIMKIDPGVWNDPDSTIQSIMHDLSREFVRDINPDSVV